MRKYDSRILKLVFILCITFKNLSVVRSDEGVSSVKKKDPEKLNPWKDRMDKILEFGTSSSFLAGLAGTATIALSAAAITELEREKQYKALISPKESNKNLSWKNPVKKRSEKSHASYSKGKSPSLCTEKECNDEIVETPKFHDINVQKSSIKYKSPFDIDDDDLFAREGGKLISGSFVLLQRSLGFIGDTVRVVGDTTAGLTGSSIKVVGTAVKSTSVGFNSIGDAFIGNGVKHQFSEGNVVDNTRSVAGKSIKLAGNLVRGVGESIVMAGHATETMTSSSVGVAEDAVRVFESLAYSLSSAFSPKSHYDDEQEILEHVEASYEKKNESDNISFGTHSSPSEIEDDDFQLNWYDAMILFVTTFLSEIMADNQDGVKSSAPQTLGVLIILFLLSIKLLEAKGKKESERTVSHQGTGVVEVYEKKDGIMTSETALIQKHDKDGSKKMLNWTHKNVFQNSLETIGDMMKKAVSSWSLIFIIYMLSFFYLCHVSLERSNTIMRYAEARGYKNALLSAESKNILLEESTLWLNSILEQMWRVSYPIYVQDAESKLSVYPPYVANAIMNSINIERKKRALDDDIPYDIVKVWGGLEPYISEIVGSILVEALRIDDDRPSDVAYISLDSFTLGGQSPFIRNIKTVGLGEDGDSLQFSLDLDALLQDLSVVLFVKLSSLDKAILPSTKIVVNSLDVLLPLEVTLTFREKFPFVSKMRLSLSEVPKLKVKITASSEGSVLKGVDLGSLPVLNKWIQNCIDQQLLQYVSPRFISIDIPGLLGSDEQKIERDRIGKTDISDVVAPAKIGSIPNIDNVKKTLLTLPKMPHVSQKSKKEKGGLLVVQDNTLQQFIDQKEEKFSHSTEVKERFMNAQDQFTTENILEESGDCLLKKPLLSIRSVLKNSVAPLIVSAIASSVINGSLRRESN